MTRNEFDTFCASLKATTNVVQWGNNSVWKVGGKIFAICSDNSDSNELRFSFKCSDLNFQILSEVDGIIPAPYLARAKWVLITSARAMSDEDAKDYITEAHKIISRKLTKKLQAELGL